MSSWFLYWITRLDSIKNIGNGGALVLGMVLLACSIAYTVEGDFDEIKDTLYKWLKIWVVFLLISVFAPSTKEMAFIYLAPKALENKEVQKLPNNAVKLLNKKMEEYINESLIKEEKNV